MEKLNKMYLLDVLNCKSICYTLEDAIKKGKHSFLEKFQNDFEREPINDDEFRTYIETLNDKYFYINVISGNRIKFDSSDELIEYLDTYTKHISNNDLYDFLLSLVEYEFRSYDYNGNIYSSEIVEQLLENVCVTYVEFTEESCREGKFRFIYNDNGIDTLYN